MLPLQGLGFHVSVHLSFYTSNDSVLVGLSHAQEEGRTGKAHTIRARKKSSYLEHELTEKTGVMQKKLRTT